MESSSAPTPRDGPTHLPGARGSPTVLPTPIRPGVRARFDRWYDGGRIAAINLEYRVGFRFGDLNGERVDPQAVTSLTLAGSNGRRYVLGGTESRWLAGNRVIPESEGRRSTAVSYAAERALVGGSSVVHRGQQRFFPAESRRLQLRLLLFSARFEVRDALLGFPIGSAVLLEYPNGKVVRQALDADGELTLKSLPRGDYRVSVDALGISSSRPIALSGDQDVRLQVVSWLDVAIALLALGSVALALLFIRRPSARAAALTTVLVLLVAAPSAAATTQPDRLFAYYYIWFNAGSWNRAKIDYPLLGRYSSDDRGVMERHVSWAKRAGIDGFIVSWKSTPVLNRRLERLVEVADAEDFKLLVIYQGLDFHRHPLPASRVGADLDFFTRRFAADRAFDAFGKPLVIWSGTPSFARAEIARVTEPRRGDLSILASERNVDAYERVAPRGRRKRLLLGVGQPAHLPGAGRQARPDGRGGARPRRHLDPVGRARLRRAQGGRHECGRAARRGDPARRAGRRRELVPGRDRPDQLERVQREHPHRAESRARIALPPPRRRGARGQAPGNAGVRLERAGRDRLQLRSAAAGRARSLLLLGGVALLTLRR